MMYDFVENKQKKSYTHYVRNLKASFEKFEWPAIAGEVPYGAQPEDKMQHILTVRIIVRIWQKESSYFLQSHD